MNFTIWLTDECNLACSYCYVEKKKNVMSMDTCVNALAFMKDIMEEKKSDDIRVIFHGGEPTLNFKALQYIVNKCNEYFGQDRTSYAMTTNGISITPDQMKFYVENIRYGISVSVDGKKEIHNLYRRNKEGQGTFEKVIDCIRKFNENNCYLRLRMTVNANNVKHLSEGFQFLSELNNMNTVVYAINLDDVGWDARKISILYEEEKKIIKYLVSANTQFAYSYLENLRMEYFRQKGKCKIGENSFHISPNGIIYPCIRTMGNEKFAIGNVIEGIDYNAIVKLKDEIECTEENVVCLRCKWKFYCDGMRCKLINKIIQNDYNKPSPVLCHLQHTQYKIINEFQKMLEEQI